MKVLLCDGCAPRGVEQLTIGLIGQRTCARCGQFTECAFYRSADVGLGQSPFERQLKEFKPNAMLKALADVLKDGPCTTENCFVCSGSVGGSASR